MSNGVTRSETIGELASALSVAQGMIQNAAKDSANPFFNSSYADLASIRDAVRDPFASNGLAVIQLPSADGNKVTITTILTHKSGEWVSSELTMTSEKSSPQAIGSVITYARRYALAAVAGVAPEDDDGEGATDRKKAQAEVANKKIAQMKQKAGPVDAAASKSEAYQKMGVAFTDLFQQYADAGHEVEYWGFLHGSYGVSSASEFPDNEAGIKLAKKCYKDLGAELQRLKHPEPSDSKPFSDGFKIDICVGKFQELKDRMSKAMGPSAGEAEYRRILNAHHVSSSNKFRDAESATPCYCAMLEAAKQAESLGVSEGDAK